MPDCIKRSFGRRQDAHVPGGGVWVRGRCSVENAIDTSAEHVGACRGFGRQLVDPKTTDGLQGYKISCHSISFLMYHFPQA